MEAEGEEFSADEILDDRNFNIIYPENARVKEKLKNRRDREEKIRLEQINKKKSEDEAINKKNLKARRDEEERERRRLEMENAQLNYEKFEESVKNGN